MARFVNLYLLVTGGLAALALAIPSLVVLGMFLLVLPGLILGFAPTAFLWGLAFAIPWYGLRPMLGDYVAIAPAVLVAASFFWFMPQPSIAQSKARLAQSLRPEITPTEQIGLVGHIRIDAPSIQVEEDEAAPDERVAGDRRRYVCDSLCAALLATPGVKSVTVNGHGAAEAGGTDLTRFARTFRVVPKNECSGPSVRPKDADALGIDRRWDPTRPRPIGMMQAEWDVRLSTRDCIVAEAPRSEFDFVIRKHSYRAFANDSPPHPYWSIGPLSVRVERLDVIDRAGRMLLSKSLVSTETLVQPLHIAPAGGLDNFRLQWGRKRLTNRERDWQLNFNQLLADHTNLRTEADRSLTIQASRNRLAEALADPALPASDPAFKLADPWLRSLEGRPMAEEDRTLLVKLIRDSRVSDYSAIWVAIKAAGEHAGELREPMIDRIASVDLLATERVKQIGMALDALPPGTFATMTEAERAILADPDRRALAPGLISRQSDRGNAAVPMLLEMLDNHLREIADRATARRNVRGGDMVVVDRVRMAFCQLGPDASAALTAIDRLASEGLIDRRFAEAREWQLMLARIGKPINEIAKPKNLSGSEAQFRRNLQMRLERFRPERDCRSQWS